MANVKMSTVDFSVGWNSIERYFFGNGSAILYPGMIDFAGLDVDLPDKACQGKKEEETSIQLKSH